MIRSFRGADTENLASGQRVRRFESIARVARRKLRQLESPAGWTTCASRPATGSKRSGALGKVNTAFGSMISGESAFSGRLPGPKTSRSSTITEELLQWAS
jgi:hypothetical protein